jgi:diguanylate cyclase (GGDEF)-like protein/PAS domain S-box-containing protein
MSGILADKAQRALVVDDSTSALALMTQLLGTLEGCEPIGFTSSLEALHWSRENEIDLVVVDYEMPALNGIEFITAFREDPRNAAIPVVMVTSTADRDIRYKALQLGATDFLAKPIDPAEFVARMRNLLASCRAHKILAEWSEWLTDEVRKITMAVAQSPVSVVILDRHGVIEYVNPKFTEASGYRAEEVIGQNVRILGGDYIASDQAEEIWETIAAGKEYRGTLQHRRKDGTVFWETLRLAPMRNEAGEVVNLVAIAEDVTRNKEYEARLDWQANYDRVTGLPNRMLLVDRMEKALAVARAGGSKLAVMIAKLNRFREISNTLGHEAGDEILRQVAARLQAGLREADTVSRFRAEEFALVIPEFGDGQTPQAVAVRIAQQLEAPLLIDGAEVFLSAGIGIALFPENGAKASVLLRSASAAIPKSDSEAHSAWGFFSPALDEEARRSQAIETNLRHALGRDELRVHYHPLVEVRTGKLVGAEALLRWHNPQLGWVPPDQFVPVAERNGLIVPIGAWVIETVSRDMAAWRAAGLQQIRVAVNVSSRQLADEAFLDILARAFDGTGIAAHHIEIEVTERLALNPSAETMALIETLRARGFRFSIDDFGTGYSAMSYLTAFPFDVLKIDRSFVSKITERSQDAALTQAIIAMAHSLGLQVVAEGVETAEQLDFLKAAGCDFAQGYLFTLPMPAADFAAQMTREVSP